MLHASPKRRYSDVMKDPNRGEPAEEGICTDWGIDRSEGDGIGIDTHDVSASVRNNLV